MPRIRHPKVKFVPGERQCEKLGVSGEKDDLVITLGRRVPPTPGPSSGLNRRSRWS